MTSIDPKNRDVWLATLVVLVIIVATRLKKHFTALDVKTDRGWFSGDHQQ